MKSAPLPFSRFALACFFTATLAACAPLSSVKLATPTFVPTTDAPEALEEQAEFREASRVARRHPVAGLETYIAAAEEAAQQLEKDPTDSLARESYNFALHRIFGSIGKLNLNPWHHPLRVGDYVLDYRAGDFADADPALFDIIPDDQLKVRSAYLTESAERTGLGAPLVVVSREKDEDYGRKFRAASRIYYTVTGIARFDGKRCTLSIYDPLDRDTVMMNGERYPLEADFTSFLAVLMNREGARKTDLIGLLRPGSHVETARLAMLQPYDPDRIPLVMVHGLMDSPVTWVPMLNYLRADPIIREKYQLWFYSYPSGYPYPLSAALLRKQLDAIEAITPGRKPMVMMGHSMGGMITRLMLTDSGTSVWNELIGRPIEEVNLNRKDHELLADVLIFKSRPEIARAIFIASPHQGSELASNWVGRIGSSLVRLPLQVFDLGDTILKVFTFDTTGIQAKRLPNSIDTLKPDNRFVLAVAKLPLRPGVPYHTIVGDRGRGDTPESSDGVVPYWSSHLEGAVSEKIVPSNHSAHQNRAAMEEVRRILRIHVGAE